MNNFNDFDLDLKKINESKEPRDKGDVVTSVINCTIQISEWLKCTPACPVPTRGAGQKPVASCHKMAKGNIQPRC